MATSDVLTAVLNRNGFYRDGHRTLLKIALIEGVAILALILALCMVAALNRPVYQYFATTEDGKLIPLIPLDRPNVEDAALLSWVNTAVMQVMTFGFHDYRMRLQESKHLFTQSGYENFLDALKQGRVLEQIEATQTVVTAVPTSAPVILKQGIDPWTGTYMWQIQVKATVTYQTITKSSPNNMVITIDVARMSALDNPAGIGINKWVAQAGRG